MLPYWLFFIAPAMMALVSDPPKRMRADGTRPIRIDPVWMLTVVVLTIVIGFRYDVGGDWANYYRYLSTAEDLTFTDLKDLEDPGYWALNILSVRLGWGMTGVNTFSALIFSIGLVVFCQSLPRPWLALACAMPYLVTVVGMGYTRQAIALGLVIIGLVMLSRRRLLAFTIWILLGALFHKSAVLMIPIAGITSSKNRWLTLGLVASATFLGYVTLIQDSSDRLLSAYTDENMQSSGALIRLSMNLIPALLFLQYRHRFALALAEKNLWFWLSLISISLFVAFFMTSLSTALDRMALYVIPLQLFVFAHLPKALGSFGRPDLKIVAIILLYHALVLFVWLNFADHAFRWVPYQLGLA